MFSPLFKALRACLSVPDSAGYSIVPRRSPRDSDDRSGPVKDHFPTSKPLTRGPQPEGCGQRPEGRWGKSMCDPAHVAPQAQSVQTCTPQSNTPSSAERTSSLGPEKARCQDMNGMNGGPTAWDHTLHYSVHKSTVTHPEILYPPKWGHNSLDQPRQHVPWLVSPMGDDIKHAGRAHGHEPSASPASVALRCFPRLTDVVLEGLRRESDSFRPACCLSSPRFRGTVDAAHLL